MTRIMKMETLPTASSMLSRGPVDTADTAQSHGRVRSANISSRSNSRAGLYSRSNLRHHHQQQQQQQRYTNGTEEVEDGVVVQPMLEQNVKTHTEQSQLDKPPKVSLDDCCGYCEKYREGAITPQKRMEIETWRQAVNHSKYDGSMKKSITIPIDFRYSPPGYPADEPGFRRIKVTGDLKKNIRKMNLERANQQQGGLRKNARKPVNGVDFQRLTTDVAAMSMDYDAERRYVTPSNVEELPSTWKQNWPDRVAGGATSPASPRLKSGRGYRMVGTMYNKRKLVEAKQATNDKQKLNRNDTKMTSVSSRGSTNSLTSESASDKNEYRTCSNDLLNVISIDDFRMRHKTFQQPIREDSETSLRDSSQKALETRSAGGQGYPSRSVAAGSHRPGSNAQRRHLQSDNGRQMTSPTESGYDSQPQNMYYYDEYGPNETVNKAFDSILCGDNVATNSHAHRGLFKYESRVKEPTGRPKESKRFRRLNRALHDWIENEIVIPHQATRGWYLSSSGSYHATQSPTTTISQGHRRSTLKSEGQSDQDNGGFLDMVQEMDETNEHQTQAAQ